MARKHNTKHRRSPSSYPHKTGGAATRMRWTGDTTETIVRDLARMRDADRKARDVRSAGYHHR